MLTIEEIETWRKQQGLSKRALSEKLHASYSGLCQVLAGNRPLTRTYALRIADVMQAEQKSIKVTLPAEYEAKVRTWAAQAHMQIDELLNALLDGMLKGEIKPRP